MIFWNEETKNDILEWRNQEWYSGMKKARMIFWNEESKNDILEWRKQEWNSGMKNQSVFYPWNISGFNDVKEDLLIMVCQFCALMY